jgi:hypothetical protein
MEELAKNIEFAQAINDEGNGTALKRNPPTTMRGQGPASF